MSTAGVFNIGVGEGETVVHPIGKKMFYRFTNTGGRPFEVNGKTVRVGCSIDLLGETFRVFSDQSPGEPRRYQGTFDLITFV